MECLVSKGGQGVLGKGWTRVGWPNESEHASLLNASILQTLLNASISQWKWASLLNASIPQQFPLLLPLVWLLVFSKLERLSSFNTDPNQWEMRNDWPLRPYFYPQSFGTYFAFCIFILTLWVSSRVCSWKSLSLATAFLGHKCPPFTIYHLPFHSAFKLRKVKILSLGIIVLILWMASKFIAEDVRKSWLRMRPTYRAVQYLAG